MQISLETTVNLGNVSFFDLFAKAIYGRNSMLQFIPIKPLKAWVNVKRKVNITNNSVINHCC